MKRMLIAVMDSDAEPGLFISSTEIDTFDFDGLVEASGKLIDEVCETYEIPEGVTNYELPE